MVYFEVDFPEVLSKKLTAIKRKKVLWGALDASCEEELLSDAPGVSGIRELYTQHCRFVSTDMRISGELASAVAAAGLRPDVPTLFLAECVLVYMQAMHGTSLIEWAAKAVPSAPSSFLMYEQSDPDDPFGRMMVQNLAQRGCPLLSIHDYPTKAAQCERFLSSGWGQCTAVDMNDVYARHLDQEDVQRTHKIEMMDEFEEWHLIQAHYFVLIATRSPDEASAEQEAEGGDARGVAGGEDPNSWVHTLLFPHKLGNICAD